MTPSRKKRLAGDNPWGVGATTLEWTLPSPPPFHTVRDVAAHRRSTVLIDLFRSGRRRGVSRERWTSKAEASLAT